MSSVGSRWTSSPAPPALDLGLGVPLGRKSAGAAAIRSTSAAGKLGLHGPASSAAVSTSIRPLPAGGGQRDVGRDQRHVGAAVERRGGERQAHAAAGAVADEAHRVDRLPRAAGA